MKASADHPRLWLTLALAELRLQKLDDSEKSLTRAQELMGGPFAAGLFVESLLASAKGQREVARERLEQASELMRAHALSAPRLILLKSEATTAATQQ